MRNSFRCLYSANNFVCTGKTTTSSSLAQFFKIKSLVRMYAQMEEPRKKSVVSIKKRRPKKKLNQEPSVEKSGVR